MDALDLALLAELRARPRVGDLELSRTLGIARATVSARLRRLQELGIVTGFGPDVDVAAAGFGVQAYVTLEIAQGAIDAVRDDLAAVAGVLEVHATTGSGDLVCRVAASSHEGLQVSLVEINRSKSVVRSTSVVILSTLISWRTQPLLESGARTDAGRSPFGSGRR